MVKRYWETFKEEEKNTYPWWIWVCFVIGFLIGLTAVILVAALFFLFLGWCFSGLWNYAITPIFNVTEITSYMGAALLGLSYGTIRLLKFAFKS